MEKGTDCKIDGIEARKVSIAMTPMGPQLEVVFALINSKTKEVLGWRRKKASWPPTAMKTITEFVTALEGMVAHEVFSDHAASGTKPVSISEFLAKAETQR